MVVVSSQRGLLVISVLIVTGLGLSSSAVGWSAYVGVIEEYPVSSDLPGCRDNGNKIQNELDAEGYDYHIYYDTATREDQWRAPEADPEGEDESYVDTRNRAYFCGHGNEVGGSSYQTMYSDAGDIVALEAHEVLLADEGEESEWVTFDSSYSLYRDSGNNNANLDDWHSGFRGLHMMLGWHDSPYDTDTGAEYYDSMFDTGTFDGGGYKIKNSWFKSDGGCSGNDGKRQTIIAEEPVFGDDYAHSEGGPAAGDKSNDGDYEIFTNKC